LTPGALVDHPDPEISALATEYFEFASELVSSGPERVRWPENITLKNFAVYQLIPTFVYELEFPRTNRIRPLYQTVATFGTFALLYTITETFVLPSTNPSPDQSFARTLLDLALPFMLAYILLLYIIFGEFGLDTVQGSNTIIVRDSAPEPRISCPSVSPIAGFSRIG